jgi:3-dehydroquinate synthase class II
MKNRFQKGDILQPIPGKKTSYYNLLKDLKSVEVMDVYNQSYSKYVMRVKILEGSSGHYQGQYRKGEYIQVYNDAFEYLVQGEQAYEIF